MESICSENDSFTPWNKEKLVGKRPPLKQQEIWAIRIQLQISKFLKSWLYSTSLSTAN